MLTKQQIIAQGRSLISQETESTSDFTDSQLLGFLNEGCRFLAVLAKWPRDLVEVQVQVGVPAYAVLSDTIMLRTAYFGNVSIDGDVKPLKILAEESLASVKPNWLTEHSNSWDRPRYIILLDKNTVLINPTPSAAESASGKKLIIGYVYSPPVLVNDGDIPDLPLTFQDLLPQYIQSKCYLGKLNLPDLGSKILNDILAKAKLLDPIITKEFENRQMTWGIDADNVEQDSGFGIYFT